MAGVCTIEDCTSPALARGWCAKHYNRWQRHGDPLVTSRQPPTGPGATHKVCPRCGDTKSLNEFGLRPSGRPKGYCFACEARYQQEHGATSVGRESHRRARSKWNDGNHGYFLQYRYGISREDYDRILASQSGRCAICRTDDPGGKDTVWCVDHCHTTNRVRGLLCGLCNRGLGQFRDDITRLRAAVTYLEQHA